MMRSVPIKQLASHFRTLTGLICLWLAALTLQAATINVPADQPTIQAGIDAAYEGDTVLVSDGTYNGDGNQEIDFDGKNLALVSENGPELTIIDCGGRALHVHSGEDSTSVVHGFTFSGWHHMDAAAIVIEDSSSLTIKHCYFSGNSSWSLCDDGDCSGLGSAARIYDGGLAVFRSCNFNANSHSAVAVDGSDCSLIDCQFTGNYGEMGGAIIGREAVVEVSGTVFSANWASGGCWYRGGMILRCWPGSGGAIHATSSDLVISRTTFVGNTTSQAQGDDPPASDNHGGSAIYFADTVGTRSFILSSSVVAFNSVCVGGPIYISMESLENVSISCSDQFGNVGGDWVGLLSDQSHLYGNFTSDPNFCDMANGDYHLSNASRCAPENNECDALIGAFGVQCSCCGLYTSGYTGNTDCSSDGKRNLSDIARMIDNIYVSRTDICCEANGNVDGDAESLLSLADITRLIDKVYLSKQETAPCQ